nr:hypothetical protein [Picosynechococcus sp. NKBG15041c]
MLVARPDSSTLNLPSGAKDSESSAKSNPATLSGNNLWELSIEVYEQSLADAEWQDIKQQVLQSPLQILGPPTAAKDSFSLPTLTTGSGTIRNAGRTKLEDKLKKLDIIPPGYQLSPEAMASYMGFPWDLFTPITGQRLTQISTLFPTGYGDAMMSVDWQVKALPPPKQQSPSISSTGTLKKKRGRPQGSTGKASGCLVPFTETRHGKTYPIIEGKRVSKSIALDYPHHYRWFYQWKEWNDPQQRWSTKSKRLHSRQVIAVHRLIQTNQQVSQILNFINTGKLSLQ